MKANKPPEDPLIAVRMAAQTAKSSGGLPLNFH